jgi:hypothetical protein
MSNIVYHRPVNVVLDERETPLIIDKDSTASVSQSAVATPPSSSSNDTQVPSALSAQEDFPSPNADSSSVTSLKTDPEP